MERTIIEKVIKKHPQFRLKNKFSDKTLLLLLKRVNTRLSLDDVIAFYDQSSLLKIKGMLVSVKGLHIINEKEVIFDKLKDVTIQNESIGITYQDNSWFNISLDRKDRVLVKKFLDNIMKENTKTVVKEVTKKEEPMIIKDAPKASVVKETPKVKENPEEYFNKAEEFYSQKLYKEAVAYYQKAADLNHSLALGFLGFAYENGEGVEVDYKKAKECYEKACQNNSAYGYFRLGHYYKNIENNKILSANCLKKAADLGHVRAMNSYAICVRDGIGCDANINEAIEYFKKAADHDDVNAAYNLGSMYNNGKYVKQDFDKAIIYFSKAASLGDVEACQQLYFIYYGNKDYPTNFNEALKWVNIGANKGDLDCKVYKGTLYMTGAFGQDVYREGFDLLFEGARKNSDMAKTWLVVETARKNYRLTDQEYDEIISYASLIDDLKKYIPVIKDHKESYRKPTQNKSSISHPTLDDITDAYVRFDLNKMRNIIKHCVEYKYIPNDEFYEFASSQVGDILMHEGRDEDVELLITFNDIYNELLMYNTQASYDEGLKYYQNGEYRKAIRLFKEIYEKGRMEVAVDLGDVYFSMKNYNEAISWYKKATGKEVKVKLAEVYIAYGKISEARDLLVREAHSSQVARRALITHLIEGTFSYTVDMIPYVKQFIKSSELSESDKSKLQHIMSIYETEHRKDIFIAKAKKYEIQGDLYKCAQTYEECIKEFEDIHIIMTLAFFYENKLHDMNGYYRMLMLACDYNHPDAHYHMAHYYKDKGDLKLYRRYLEEASKLNHTRARIEYNNLSAGFKNTIKPMVNKKCNLCADCIKSCPLDLIRIQNGKLVIDSEECIGCRECVRTCKHSALRMFDFG